MRLHTALIALFMVLAAATFSVRTDAQGRGQQPVQLPDGAGKEMAPLRPGMSLDYVGDRTWTVHDGDTEVVQYPWEELRFSVSWKAYCFEDEHEQQTWRDNTDDLTIDAVVERLTDDLRERGRINGAVPGNPDLALMIIDEYIRFPTPA